MFYFFQSFFGDNNLENLPKTGSLLSHFARNTGVRTNSTSSKSSPAMKSSSGRSNSNSGNSGNRTENNMRVKASQQHSCSESSVCEEALEIDHNHQIRQNDTEHTSSVPDSLAV